MITSPDYDFAALAIESDNFTVQKLAEMYHKELKIVHKDHDFAFYYTMYSFRNFVYIDPVSDEKMFNYLQSEIYQSLTNS